MCCRCSRHTLLACQLVTAPVQVRGGPTACASGDPHAHQDHTVSHITLPICASLRLLGFSVLLTNCKAVQACVIGIHLLDPSRENSSLGPVAAGAL